MTFYYKQNLSSCTFYLHFLGSKISICRSVTFCCLCVLSIYIGRK